MTNWDTILNSVIITAGVFAALITAIANIVISIINNGRLKGIEKKKELNEIDKYRYSRLYELILNWHKYDSQYTGNTPSEIASSRLVNLFLDNSGRYEIAKPLLDAKYIDELDDIFEKGNHLLKKLLDAENPDGSHTKEFNAIKNEYFDVGGEFSDKLKAAINEQLKTLLKKNN